MANSSQGNYSLFWNRPNGLAARFWPLTEQHQKRRFSLERQLDLNEVDVATLDFSEKVYINRVDYFVANLAIDLPIKQPAMALMVRD